MLVLAVACGGAPDPLRERESVASWGAVVGTSGGQWVSGALPAHFVRQLLKEAGGALGDEQRSIAQIPAPRTREELRAAVDSLRTTITVLRSAMDRGDRGSMHNAASIAARISARLRGIPGDVGAP